MSRRSRADIVPSGALPTQRDVDRLSLKVRRAARARGLPRQVAERYIDWILIFVAWCLQAPPHELHSDRVGAFWTALVQHDTARRSICEAMDAVAFLFGALGGPEKLRFPAGRSKNTLTRPKRPSETGPGDATVERRSTGPDELDLPASRPNPRLRLSDPDPAAHRDWTTSEDLAQYLPDGSLPTGVDARRAVPTRTNRETADREWPDSTPPPVPPDRPGLLPSGDGPATLFDPEKTASPPPETDIDDREAPGPSGSRNEGSEERFGKPHPGTLAQLCRGECQGRASSEGAPERRAPSGGEAIREEQEPASGQQEKVSLQIPGELADRLRQAARRVGLPPAVFVARALDLICNDVGDESSDPEEAGSIIEHYQAQLDLLHLGKGDQADPPGDSVLLN